MEDFKERLNCLIDKFGGGEQARFAALTKIKKTTLNEYCSGKRGNPQISFLTPILETFESVNPNWLLTGKGEMLLNSEKHPSENTEINGEKYLINEQSELEKELAHALEKIKLQYELIAALKINVEYFKNKATEPPLNEPRSA